MGVPRYNTPEEKYAAHLRANKAYAKRNPHKTKGWTYQYRYGRPLSSKDVLLIAQGGVCAICGTAKPGHKNGWQTDHNPRLPKHHPEFVRGILCTSCNQALGKFNDSAAVVQKAANYLKEHDGRL